MLVTCAHIYMNTQLEHMHTHFHVHTIRAHVHTFACTHNQSTRTQSEHMYAQPEHMHTIRAHAHTFACTHYQSTCTQSEPMHTIRAHANTFACSHIRTQAHNQSTRSQSLTCRTLDRSISCTGMDCRPLSEGNRDGGSLTVCADFHGQRPCKPQCCP